MSEANDRLGKSVPRGNNKRAGRKCRAELMSEANDRLGKRVPRRN